MFLKGEKVRVFSIIKGSWVLAEILNSGENDSFVLIREWYSLPKNSVYRALNKDIERICG